MISAPASTCSGLPVLLVTSVGVVVGGCGQVPGVADPAGGNPTGTQDWCVALARETISLAEELLEIAEQGGAVDPELACQFLANEVQLLDGHCIDESDLAEGTTRESLLVQLGEYNCPTQTVASLR